MEQCDSESSYQRWDMENYDSSKLNNWDSPWNTFCDCFFGTTWNVIIVD